MISLGSISSSVVRLGQRILKFTQYGAKTADECAPFGYDANPVPGTVAVHAATDNVEDNAIIGYINQFQKASVGEVRLYSVKQGVGGKAEIAIFAHLKNDGTIEFGGANDNLVRYAALNTALQQQVILINTELAKISAGLAGVGGVYTPAPISLNITTSKINELKTL